MGLPMCIAFRLRAQKKRKRKKERKKKKKERREREKRKIKKVTPGLCPKEFILDNVPLKLSMCVCPVTRMSNRNTNT
jgi:hypothetical protein